MLISSVLLGVGAGLAFGGRLSRLAQLELAWVPLLAAALLLRVIAPSVDPVPPSFYLLASAAIVVVALINRRLPGMNLVAVGAALNLLVVASNRGMPVDAAAAAMVGANIPSDRLHIVLDDTARLPWLADVIPLPVLANVYSVGDVLLALGGFWLPFQWLRRP